ncbi:hypothetical protein Tco_0246853 [Tanacetum coccineum]
MKHLHFLSESFSRIPFGVTPKVILIAWERFGEIKYALKDEQYQQEDIQELMSKLLEDVRNISEELSEYINCPSWNRPIFYDNDDDEYTIIYSKPKAITPDLPTVEPDNSLSMGDEHLDTIPSVENLVPIPSEFKGISEDTCDVPVCEDPSTFDALNDHSEILSDSNDDGTSSDDDDFEDIEYVSLEEVNDVDQEEKEFDLEDILQIQDVILHEKLLNISRLITNIESLNDNPTPDHVFKSPSSFPIPVTDSDSFFDSPDKNKFSSLIRINLYPNSSLLAMIQKRQEVAVPLLMLITLFSNSIPPGIESNFDLGGGEIDFFQNVEDDDSFTFVIRTFLPFLTYPVDSPLLLSTGSEDTIFDPGISSGWNFHFGEKGSKLLEDKLELEELMAEERFLKIQQTMEEEQNQPKVMQELLLKLMNDLQILKGIQQEKEKPAAQSFTPYGKFSMIDDVEVLMKDIYTFLRKFKCVCIIFWE